MNATWVTDALGGPDTHTSRELHLVSTVPVAFALVALGHHPLIVVPLVAGSLFPEVDAIDERLHRSWLFHTYFVPALVYFAITSVGIGESHPWLVTEVHVFSVGLTLHFLADYVYPKGMDHPGSVWPVRPFFISAPWGLIWLGVAWLIQWFVYLSDAFLPWFVTAL